MTEFLALAVAVGARPTISAGSASAERSSRGIAGSRTAARSFAPSARPESTPGPTSSATGLPPLRGPSGSPGYGSPCQPCAPHGAGAGPGDVVCLRTTHCLVATASWLAITPLEPAPALGGALIAFATGGGPLSPDCDIWIPGLGHRKTTHIIEWPIIAGLVAWGLHMNGSSYWWVLGAVAMAWLSHLILDIFSGKRGVPSILLGRLRVTAWLWMHTGGWFELRFFRPFVAIVVIPGVIIFRILLDLGAFG